MPRAGSSSPRTVTSATATCSSSPHRLLVIATGNITNDELSALVTAKLAYVLDAFAEASHVERRRDRLIVHG
jgi:predicted nuclease of predicted toxin-antitoxin system